MRKKGSMHTFISCWMDISSRKCIRIHYSWCPTAFISLLISIMKMLSHLFDKNQLFQELKPWRPCGTTLVLCFQSFILSLSKSPVEKTCDDFTNSSSIHQFLSLSIIPFRYENSISVLIDPQWKIISLLERVPCGGLTSPSHLLISDSVSK